MMNAVDNETVNTLKQSSNSCIKQNPAIEKKYNRVDNSQPHIEYPDYIEQIIIDEM